MNQGPARPVPDEDPPARGHRGGAPEPGGIPESSGDAILCDRANLEWVHHSRARPRVRLVVVMDATLEPSPASAASPLPAYREPFGATHSMS